MIYFAFHCYTTFCGSPYSHDYKQITLQVFNCFKSLGLFSLMKAETTQMGFFKNVVNF